MPSSILMIFFGDFGGDLDAGGVVAAGHGVAHVEVDAVGFHIHVDAARISQLLELCLAFGLEFGGVGVAELVDACALIRAFDGLRMAERAFLVGVPVDDDPVLEFALAEADQVVDRMRGEGRIEVDEVGVDEVAGGRDRRRVDCHAVLRCGDAQPQS